jgi:succinate semialdehyde reductase (NADPH)
MVDGSMRAAILEKPHADLKIEEVLIPEPRAGEVLLNVTACRVCHSDLHVIKDEISFPTPAVLGHEVSGTVKALGPGLEERAGGALGGHAGGGKLRHALR